MRLTVDIEINRPKEDVWKVITDIENSADFISAVEKIEIVEKPDKGLKGTKWIETRMMLGRELNDKVIISDVTDNESYTAQADSYGAMHSAKLSLKTVGDMTKLAVEFEVIPLAINTKIAFFVLRFFVKAHIKKTLQNEVLDIKRFTEKMLNRRE